MGGTQSVAASTANDKKNKSKTLHNKIYDTTAAVQPPYPGILQKDKPFLMSSNAPATQMPNLLDENNYISKGPTTTPQTVPRTPKAAPPLGQLPATPAVENPIGPIASKPIKSSNLPDTKAVSEADFQAVDMLGGLRAANQPLKTSHGYKLINKRYDLPTDTSTHEKKAMYDREAKLFEALQKPDARLSDFYQSLGILPDEKEKQALAGLNQPLPEGGMTIDTPGTQSVFENPLAADEPYVPFMGADESSPIYKGLPEEPSSNRDWLEDLQHKTAKAAKGVMGPAYEQSIAMLRLGLAFSPGADVQDMMQGSSDLYKAVANLDGAGMASASAMMGGSLAGLFVQGNYSGIKRSTDELLKSGRTTRDMPCEQRLKHEGAIPVIPDSVEQNIQRGTNALVAVLKSNKADMAAMHRKDLGWIAFEPGSVKFHPKKGIVGGGLHKILEKHPGDLAMLPDVIAKGKLRYEISDRGRRGAVLLYKGYKTSFRMNMNGDQETWVLTHFILKK